MRVAALPLRVGIAGLLLCAACSSSATGLHGAVMVDVEVADTTIAIDGATIDPGTAGAGHGVGTVFDLDALDADTPHTVTAAGAVSATLTVPANDCAALCPADSCDLGGVRFAWTQVVATADGLALGCLRCDGATGTAIASACPP